MKGVGRIDQQIYIDTYAKVAFALYDRKTPITAADLLNGRVVPVLLAFTGRERIEKLYGLIGGGGSADAAP